MDLWIPLTVVATVIQNARSIGQRQLLGRVSVAGVTYGRFFYGFPLALALLGAVCIIQNRAPPTPSFSFVAILFVGAASQVVGNALFVKLVRASNFTVMTTYSKMETVISPIFSFVLLHDVLSPAGIVGVVIAFLGVMLLAAARGTGGLGDFLGACLRPPASLGIAVGAIYAVASTTYRAAALDLGDVGFLMQAITVLVWATGMQAIAGGGYVLWRMPPVMTEVIREWRPIVLIGASGVAASACWMSAFALQKTGYVLAVGQIELVFAYIASHVLLKERMHRREILAMLVTVAGILLVVAAR